MQCARGAVTNCRRAVQEHYDWFTEYSVNGDSSLAFVDRNQLIGGMRLAASRQGWLSLFLAGQPREELAVY
jgi:hypothetical protein